MASAKIADLDSDPGSPGREYEGQVAELMAEATDFVPATRSADLVALRAAHSVILKLVTDGISISGMVVFLKRKPMFADLTRGKLTTYLKKSGLDELIEQQYADRVRTRWGRAAGRKVASDISADAKRKTPRAHIGREQEDSGASAPVADASAKDLPVAADDQPAPTAVDSAEPVRSSAEPVIVETVPPVTVAPSGAPTTPAPSSESGRPLTKGEQQLAAMGIRLHR